MLGLVVAARGDDPRRRVVPHRVWPRAQSKLYDEPKKLVECGLARARIELGGRRPRTVYAITPKGRRELARWLQEAGVGPILEFEGLLKLAFAENGTKSDALASIAAAREWALERNAENLATARLYRTATSRSWRKMARQRSNA